MQGVVVYFDDVFISGRTREEHDKRVNEVLTRLKEADLTVTLEQCAFAQKSVHFLGYELDEQGLHVSDKKIKAIVKMNAPTNVQELQSFLGAMNYFVKFIKNYARIVTPLYELLRKDVKWHWTTDRQLAFEEAKKQLMCVTYFVTTTLVFLLK